MTVLICVLVGMVPVRREFTASAIDNTSAAVPLLLFLSTLLMMAMAAAVPAPCASKTVAELAVLDENSQFHSLTYQGTETVVVEFDVDDVVEVVILFFMLSVHGYRFSVINEQFEKLPTENCKPINRLLRLFYILKCSGGGNGAAGTGVLCGEVIRGGCRGSDNDAGYRL